MQLLYGLQLCVQTFLALAGLGLIGGWALFPFRRDDRPYLWLASPLAGVAALSAGLVLLCQRCGLSVQLAFPLLLAGGATATLLLQVYRFGDEQRWSRGLVVGGLAVVLVITWATGLSNRTALRHREPTLCMRDGSDGVGYCQVADWLLYHPGERPRLDPAVPHQAWPAVMLESDGRPGAYLLTATAALVRGTRPLFSYDWACGVALAAGVLGLAGLFASRPRELLLLLATGMVSLWFPVSRAGYLGKLLGYPGVLLLCHLYLSIGRRLTLSRLLCAGVLGTGVGLSLHIIVAQLVLGFLLTWTAVGGILTHLTGRRAIELTVHVAAGVSVLAAVTLGLIHNLFGFGLLGFAIAGCLVFIGGRLEDTERTEVWNRLGRALLAYAAIVAPLAVWGWMTNAARSPGGSRLPWSWLVPMMLDLDSQAAPLVDPGTTMWLTLAALVLTGVFLILAWRTRDSESPGFLLGIGILPLAWLLDRPEPLLQFHGLLFPLSAVGVILVLQRLTTPRSAGIGFALALAFLALRLPQGVVSFQRYTETPHDSPHYFVRSDIETLVQKIGDRTVDVNVHDLYASIVLLTELGPRGVRVQYREPTWTRLVSYLNWPVPDYPAKGEFTLGDTRGFANPETVRFSNRQYKLCEDRDTASILSLIPPTNTEVGWDDHRRPSFWLDRTVAAIEFWNGTGAPTSVLFTAEVVSDSLPPSQVRALRYQVTGSAREQAVAASARLKLRIPVRLRTGINRLTLSAYDPTGSDVHERLMRITNFTLEAPAEGARTLGGSTEQHPEENGGNP